MTSAGCEERLFEVPEAVVGVPSREPVDKTFLPYDQDQVFLLPPSLMDWLPEDHLARFVSELVDEALDLSPIYASYTEVRGAPPYDPRMMLKLLIYAYCTGVCSSRAIERRCRDDVAFRFLSANQAPDYRSIARFRRRHLPVVKALFVQGLRLCRRAGMVKLGRVALDGTKVRANASRRKAMSYERMVRREAELAAEVDALLSEAERLDAEEDARYGDRRGDELPDELARRQSRLTKIRAAKADLEAEAAEAAATRAAERARKAGTDETEAAAAARASATPRPKAQRNFTDPDSRIMKTSDGSFHQCFNGQAVVDDAHQVIVGVGLSNIAPDVGHLPDLLDDVEANLGARPDKFLADAGYCSDANLDELARRDIDAYVATGRLKHHQAPPPAPRGRIPNDASLTERMARKLRTKKGRAVYARRKVIPEPVFGQMRTRQQAGQVLLRGLAGAEGEWTLHAFCHNAMKLFTAGGLARVQPA